MNNNKEQESPTRPATAPKRVSGGIVIKAKKKKRKIQQTKSSVSSLLVNQEAQSSSGVPSILTSVPSHREEDNNQCDKPPKSKHDEFDDDTDEFDAGDVPSDALMCLQTYTRPPSGGMSETCAYCPIFTHDQDGASSTHAVPFLPKHILLHILNVTSKNNATSSRTTHLEQEIKQLASSSKIRLLQLHGTAGRGSDGNDEEDIAVLETPSYVAAAEMALQSHFSSQSTTVQHKYKMSTILSWLTTALLPHFAGKIWFSSGALDNFYDSPQNDNYSQRQLEDMIQQLVHTGILMPRRGAASGGGGYWFSLPGLGKTSKSIVDGRMNLMKRVQSSQYKEKKRSVLEQEIGRIKQKGGKRAGGGTELSGKFVVLDLLAKGLVHIHTTSTGEQFVRLMT